MSNETHPEPVTKQSEQSIWLRGLFMLLFILIYGVAEVVVTAVALIQFGWIVASEQRNPRLERFGASLAEFIRDVIRYWTFVSDEIPFPFSEWPQAQGRSAES